MSDIILGNNFRLYYNTDTGNALPQGIDNEEIENLAGFPVLTINSDTSSYDTYDSDYVSKLLADMSVSDMEIVVNYVPDSQSATFLDDALLNQTEFQLILVYYYDTVAGQISYAIVNGQLYSGTVTGDKDSVVQKTYNFTTTQVKARSMVAMAAKALFEGDFGIGSDGIDIPQYAPELPTGNSLIKIPAAQNGNPASADMMGVGWIDNKQVCELAVTKAGALAIYARNANTAWIRISTTTLSDATYVALTGNQNISGNKTFTGTTTAGVVNTGALTSTTGRFNGTLTGVAGTFTGALSAASLSLTAPLPIASGGTGNANGTVARLTTLRTFIANLASTTAVAFDGTANNSHGVTGILPLANGGTGASTAAQAAINLKVVPYNGAVTTAVDINDYGITDAYVGYWQFSTVAGYASANLPEASGGVLEVIRGGDYGGLQKYTSVTGYVWIRTLTASWNATTKPWGDWKPAGYQATKAYATDLNVLTVANTYSCSASTTNKPDGITVGGWCFHYSHTAANNYYQLYVTATTGAQANRTFQRTYNGTTWTAWSESYTTLNKPSATDVGALPIVAGFSDADVNTIITAGVYSCTSVAPNIPAAITGTMEVLVRQGGLSITQIYHCNATSTGFINRHFIRTGTVSGSTTTWSTWESLTPTTQNLVTGTDLNTLTTSGRYYASFTNAPTNSNAAAIVDVTNTGGSTVMTQSLTFTTANTTWTRRYVSATWSDWVQVASSSNIGTMALPITGGTLTGTTGLTTTGAVTSRENNVTYRQLISRADAFGPYTGYNRIDQVDGTLPTAQTSIGDISARLTTTGGDQWGRTLGGMGMYYDTTGGGSTMIYARNAASALASSITFSGDTGVATMRGALVTNQISATGTVERIGGGTLSFNANRTNGAVNSFYGAQTTAGQVFFGTASGNNFVVNNTQSNTGAWLTLDASSAAFTTAVTAPSLSLTTALPIASGGTGNVNGTVGQLTTARTFVTNLASTSAGSFNGTANVTQGVSGILPIANGGTGASNAVDARTNLGLGQTDTLNLKSLELYNATPYIDFHYNNTPDDYSARIIMSDDNALYVTGRMFDSVNSYRSRRGINGAVLNTNPWNFYWASGLEVWVQGTNVGTIQMQTASDIELKKDIVYQNDRSTALSEVLEWRPASFKYKARGISEESEEVLGFIANDLIEASPECVKGEGLKDGWDENNPIGAYHLDETAMIAKLTLALQEQQKLINQLLTDVEALKNK